MATASKNKPTPTIDTKYKSDKEIDGLIFEAEKSFKKMNQSDSDSKIMQDESNFRNRSVGNYTLEKCVGKITIGPWCSSETLGALNKANLTPHTILQMETW